MTNQNYLWNCETKDNKNRKNFPDSNYTLTFDNITPEINLTSPVNNYNSSTESITFTFNLTESNKNNCSLYIDSSFSASNTTLTGSEGKVTTTISNGNHNWTINCTDLAGNIGSSNETRNITVNYIAPAQETSSSSSSSSSYSVREYSVEESILKKGYTKELRKNEIINFKIQEEEHSLKLISFDEKVLEVLIQSEPQTILISLGEEKKITFDNNTYSLLVKFNSVNRYEANITIKEINELIFPKTPSEEELRDLREKETIAFENKTEEETKNKELNRKIEELISDWKNKLNQEIIYSSIRILVGILVIIYFLSIKKRKKK